MQVIHHGWRKNFKFTSFKWLKMHLNYPPWLEKNLKFEEIMNPSETKNQDVTWCEMLLYLGCPAIQEVSAGHDVQ